MFKNQLSRQVGEATTSPQQPPLLPLLQDNEIPKGKSHCCYIHLLLYSGKYIAQHLVEHWIFWINRLYCIGLGKFWVRRRVDYRVRNKRLLSWRASFESLLMGGEGRAEQISLPYFRLFSTLFKWLGYGTSYMLIPHCAPSVHQAIDHSFLPLQVSGQLFQFSSHIRQQSGQVEAKTQLIKRHSWRSSFTGRGCQRINKEDTSL